MQQLTLCQRVLTKYFCRMTHTRWQEKRACPPLSTSARTAIRALTHYSKPCLRELFCLVTWICECTLLCPVCLFSFFCCHSVPTHHSNWYWMHFNSLILCRPNVHLLNLIEPHSDRMWFKEGGDVMSSLKVAVWRLSKRIDQRRLYSIVKIFSAAQCQIECVVKAKLCHATVFPHS